MSKTYQKEALWIYLALVIVIVAGLTCSSKSDVTESKLNPDQKFPIQEGWHSRLILTQLGRTQAIVQYGHMAQYEDQEAIELDEGVEVDFFDREGNHTSHLTSARGQYIQKIQNVTAEGQVVAVSDSGVTLQTEILTWNNQTGKITSPARVQVTTEQGDTLWGVGFESRADLSHWTILEPWGVSERHIDFESLDSTWAKDREKPAQPPDTTIVGRDSL